MDSDNINTFICYVLILHTGYKTVLIYRYDVIHDHICMYASLLIINVLLVGLFQLYMYYIKLTYSQFILLNLFFNVLWCMTHYYTIFKTNNTVSYGRNYTFDCYYTSLLLTHYFYVCVIECTAVDNFHLGGCLPYLAAQHVLTQCRGEL